jgi:hypothetical protein
MLRRACNGGNYGVFVRVRDGIICIQFTRRKRKTLGDGKAHGCCAFLFGLEDYSFFCFIACDTRQGMRRFWLVGFVFLALLCYEFRWMAGS